MKNDVYRKSAREEPEPVGWPPEPVLDHRVLERLPGGDERSIIVRRRPTVDVSALEADIQKRDRIVRSIAWTTTIVVGFAATVVAIILGGGGH